MSEQVGSTLLIFACARSNLAKATLPAGARLVELPCTGRLSLPLLLGALAHGWDGVLVLGRHQSSCRLNGAEDSARDRVERAALLAGLAGLQSARMAFVEPSPGVAGPVQAVQRVYENVNALGASPLKGLDVSAATLGRESFDTTLSLFALMSSFTAGSAEAGGHRDAAFSAFLAAHALPKATPGQATLLAGVLPQLALAGGSLFQPHDLAAVLAAALGSLARLGVGAGLVAGGHAANVANVHTLESVHALLAERGGELPCPVECATIAYDGSRANKALIEALGHRPLALDVEPLPKHFALTPVERGAAMAVLQKAQAEGARALLVNDAFSFCQWAMLTRGGSWRSDHLLPVMGVQLAQLSLAKLPLRSRMLSMPLPSGLLSAGSSKAGSSKAGVTEVAS
ncbi:MAG: hydrogenase iron-sulfur subunit [Deltaproteobacteria bacterium]|nr:hydrogenase iron-sulfur subunit [Deltaproteobacteria bacterium]